MMGRTLLKSLAPLLPAVLLGAVLHVHPEASATAANPGLSTQDSACPVCATMRGGMDSPAAFTSAPALPAPAIALVLPTGFVPALNLPELPASRGPPASSPV